MYDVTRLTCLLLAAALCPTCTACAQDPDPTDPPASADMSARADMPGADAEMEPPTFPPLDMGDLPDDGDDDEEMGPEIIQDFPARLTTAGASFEGVLRPDQRVVIELTARSEDSITMWLRQEDGSDWNPLLEIREPGASDSLVYGNPRGNEDASIPYRTSELEEGWEFFDGGTYDLVIANLSETNAPFSFTLECRGGPCTIDPDDRDGDGVDNNADNCPEISNPDQTDADSDSVGDLCDEDSGVDPYEGLSGEALKQAIVDAHTHRTLSYDEARDHMFETIDNINGFVEGVYTGTRIETMMRPPGSQLNTEHTWPQSQGADTLPARSDLHHLFPTLPEANTQRSNYPFCEVVTIDWERGGSKQGTDAEGNNCFEPRDTQKGDTARAVFYFAVIYGYSIGPDEEALLRTWHEQFGPDMRDHERNSAIAAVQQSRNPFVDFPMLVDRIDDF